MDSQSSLVEALQRADEAGIGVSVRWSRGGADGGVTVAAYHRSLRWPDGRRVQHYGYIPREGICADALEQVTIQEVDHVLHLVRVQGGDNALR